MIRKTTKDILAESFIELAQAKPVDKIRVVDIAQNCGVTKPTFYRYFRDKYDLMVWVFAREAQGHVSRIGTDGYTWSDTLLDGLRFYEENRTFMANALAHTSGRDSFIGQINEADIGYITAEIKRKTGIDAIPDDLDALIRIYCYGTGQYLCDWLMSSNPASCEMVAKAMEAAIPEQLTPYLCE